MSRTVAAALGLCLALLAPAAHAQSSLASLAVTAAASLEKSTGMPIAVLERTGDDPGMFWYRAMQILCKKTGDNWCDSDLTVLQDTTNPMGWSRVLSFQPENNAPLKRVCVILPPKPGISEGFVATGLSGGAVFTYPDLPTSDEAEAYLYLLHAANCLNETGEPTETKRADAFAALTLTLMEGSASFVPGRDLSPARRFAAFRNTETIRWAVSVGERIVLDLWKKEAAEGLRGRGCSATVTAQTGIDTETIQREGGLPRGQDCTTLYGYANGQVSDGNLWLWTAANSGVSWPTVPLPPLPYSPFKSFGSFDAGIDYAWKAAASLAAQR